jgi:hypothetical protein
MTRKMQRKIMTTAAAARSLNCGGYQYKRGRGRGGGRGGLTSAGHACFPYVGIVNLAGLLLILA